MHKITHSTVGAITIIMTSLQLSYSCIGPLLKQKLLVSLIFLYAWCCSSILSLQLRYLTLQKGRTPLHLACVGEHVEAAKCVAIYDPSSLHGIDKVSKP